MLDAAKRREFDTLIIYDPDRLARNMAKQLVLEEELHRYDVALRYCTLRLGDTAEDRLLKNMRSSIAEYEREKIALRTSRGRRAKAERGEYVGTGVAPFGYRMVRQVTPARSARASWGWRQTWPPRPSLSASFGRRRTTPCTGSCAT